MKEIEIVAKLTLVNGRFATNKNAHRIRCEKTEPGCTGVRHRDIPNPETYREVYRIKKDHWDEWKNGKPTGRKRKGYSFVEVTHGMGMVGVHRSVRALITAASYAIFGPRTDYRIVFEQEEAV